MSAGVQDAVFARQILWFAPLIKEFTHLPLNPDSRVDITPVDFVAHSLLSLARQRSRSYSNYHLSAGTSYASTVRDIFNVIADVYGTPKINFIHPEEWTSEVRKRYVCAPLQRKFYYALRYYFPFLNADVIYDNQRLAGAIGPLSLPPISEYFPEVIRQISWDDALAGSENP